MFNDAHSNCPNTIITAGGYSQGAAVMTGSVGELDDDVKSTVAGVVLYGDTRNKQENGGSKLTPLPLYRFPGMCGSQVIAKLINSLRSSWLPEGQGQSLLCSD